MDFRGKKAADLFDDRWKKYFRKIKEINFNSNSVFNRPKILVNDGNLIFESADSKDIKIELKGKSKFLVNKIDVLKELSGNGTINSGGNGYNTQTLDLLSSQIRDLKVFMRGPNGIIRRLERLELGIPANATLPPGGTDRTRINQLQRRITNLEQKVANLTLRLLQDHCKSYPCQNGGSCFNMYETFRCECPKNWEGPTCSVDVDECTKYAGTDLGCQNGATCVNLPGSYT